MSRPQTVGCAVLRLESLPLRASGQWRGQVTLLVPAGQERQAGPHEVLVTGDTARLRPGDQVTLALHTPGLPRPASLAVGGNLVLMQAGRILPSPTATDPRHPRTAVGYNGRQIIFVTVDGRQAGWSVGMRYYELARLMQQLGCREALNLDGGGSTTAWVRGRDVNRPSDGGERKIANAVLIRCRAPRGPLTRLLVRPERLAIPSRRRVDLEVQATDAWYNPVLFDPAGLRVAATRRSGWGLMVAKLPGRRLRVNASPGEGSLRFSLPGTSATAEVPLHLLPGPTTP